MPTIHFVSLTPSGDRTVQDVTARAGRTLMEAAVDADVRGIAADCVGLATCSTCHVIVAQPWAAQLPPAGGDEQGMLDFIAWPRQAGSRLSCQITLIDHFDWLTVELPPKQY